MKCPVKNIECKKYKMYSVTEIKNGNVESFKICEDCLYSISDYQFKEEKKQ